MNAKTFSDAMGVIDDKYIDEAMHYKQKARRSAWVQWGAVAACLLLLAGYALFAPATHDGRRVVDAYHTDADGCYAAPTAGEVNFTQDVREAREAYRGKNVVFLLTFELFQEGGMTEQARAQEYRRLASRGYTLYSATYWTYGETGEKQYDTVVVGYFTESDLQQFDNDPALGYLFHFATNGDGSALSVREQDVITDFPTNHS